MTSRPVYRWKSFWLGVLVLGFLGWAWWDSIEFDSRVEWRQASARNGVGGVFLMRESDYTARLTWKRRLATEPPPVDRSAFKPPFFVRGSSMNAVDLVSGFQPKSFRESYVYNLHLSPRETWLLYMPHWLVFLVFLLLWSSVLTWRACRQKKLI